jgi:putative ABC transport system substrate-binding protein
MKRREFIALIGGAVVALPAGGRAQSPLGGRPLIGWLLPSLATATPFSQVLPTRLRELGYVEGRNIWFDIRYADGVISRLPAMAAEMAAQKPDVIVAGSTPAAVAAHRATQTIPIVMNVLVDPVGLGLVKSLSHPGGNVTGIWTFGGSDALISKRISLLKEVVPTLTRLGVLVVTGDPVTAVILERLPAAAGALGLTTKVFAVRTLADVDAAIANAAHEGMQGLFIDQSPLFMTYRAEIAALTERVRVPAIYGFRLHAEAGGLMSYGSSLPAAYRQMARLVDNILKGAKPADLPVEQADKYELVINNRTAKALGLKIPESFLLLADEVIE